MNVEDNGKKPSRTARNLFSRERVEAGRGSGYGITAHEQGLSVWPLGTRHGHGNGMEAMPLISVDPSVESPPSDDQWPKIFGNGNSAIRIYRLESRKDDSVCVEFRLTYRVGDQQIGSEFFDDFEEAKRWAVVVFVELASTRKQMADVSKTWRSVYSPTASPDVTIPASDLALASHSLARHRGTGSAL